MRWVLAMVSLIACTDPPKCQCSTGWVMLVVPVRDGSSGHVPGLTKTTIQLSTGAVVTPDNVNSQSYEAMYPSTYVALDDDALGILTEQPQTFRFEVMGAAGSASAEFTAFTDECACHVMGGTPGLLVVQ